MKTKIAFILASLCTIFRLSAATIDSINPNGDLQIKVASEAGQYIKSVTIKSKFGTHVLPIAWEWSPDVAFKWYGDHEVIMYQKDSGMPDANAFTGLCAVIDARNSRLIFLNFATMLYVSRNGHTACWIPQIGRGVSKSEYAHAIKVIDIGKILTGSSGPIPTWKEVQDAHDQGCEDSLSAASNAIINLNSKILCNGTEEKAFVLAPPVFPEGTVLMGILLGIGNRVDSIQRLCIAIYNCDTRQVEVKSIPMLNIDPLKLYDSAHIPSNVGLCLKYEKSSGFYPTISK